MVKHMSLELGCNDAEVFESLTDEEAGRLVKQLLRYACGEDMDFGGDRYLALASIGIRQRMDEAFERKKTISDVRGKAGKAGAESRAKNQQKSTNATKANSVQQTATNSTNVENGDQSCIHLDRCVADNENTLNSVSKNQQKPTNATNVDFANKKDEKERSKEKEENLKELKKETPKWVKEKKQGNESIMAQGAFHDLVASQAPIVQPPSPKRFVPPKLDDVRDYIRQKGYSVDAELWWNFYESKGWMVGSNRMKNWHAAVATWVKGNRYDRRYEEISRQLHVDDFNGIDETTI